jgi:hypothetical protein
MAYYTPVGLPPPLEISPSQNLTSILYNPDLYNSILNASNNTITASTAGDAITAAKIASIYDSGKTASSNLTELAKTDANVITSIGENHGMTSTAIASNYTTQLEAQAAARIAAEKAYYDYKIKDSTNTAGVNTTALNGLTDIVRSDNDALLQSLLAKIEANKQTEQTNRNTLKDIAITLSNDGVKAAGSRDGALSSIIGTIGGSGSGGGGSGGGGSTGTGSGGSSSSGTNRPPITPSTSKPKPSSSEPDNTLNTIIQFVIGVVIIIGFGFGGYMLYNYYNKKEPDNLGKKLGLDGVIDKKSTTTGGNLNIYFG